MSYVCAGLSRAQLINIKNQCDMQEIPLISIQDSGNLDLRGMFRLVRRLSHPDGQPKRGLLITRNNFLDNDEIEEMSERDEEWLAQQERAVISHNTGLTPPLLDDLRCMVNLTFLDLSNNGLPSTSATRGLHRLKGLILSGNHIQELEPGGFAGLSELSSLDLSNNAIINLPKTAFQGS
jgi:Leucine-rich repeat (LRR) protein